MPGAALKGTAATENPPRSLRNAAGLIFSAQTMVFFTRSAVVGRWRRRLPVIWNTIAGATVNHADLAHYARRFSVARILVWISGISLMRRTG